MKARRRGSGEGAIYQRADGRWCASVDLGFVGNKRKRKVIYGKTRKEVADKLKAIHRDLAAGIDIAPAQQTVTQFLDNYGPVLPDSHKQAVDGLDALLSDGDDNSNE